MPVLPHLYRRLQDVAEDTRIVDARQLEEATAHAARNLLHVLERGVEKVAKRAPAIAKYTTATATTATHATLVRRQNADVCTGGFINGCYQGLNGGPNPGAVVGIVLGAVAGFLLLLWILFILSSGGSFIQSSNLQEEEVNVVHHHGRHRSRSPRRDRSTHRSSYREEMRQTHTSPAPAPRRDRVIRQERISRDIPREQSRVRNDPYIVEETRTERRVDGDDVIEVIAEGSDMTSAAPAPRRSGGGRRRSSAGYRSVSPSPDRIRSGYRRVDPSRFAGGNDRVHRVR